MLRIATPRNPQTLSPSTRRLSTAVKVVTTRRYHVAAWESELNDPISPTSPVPKAQKQSSKSEVTSRWSMAAGLYFPFRRA